MTESEFIHEVMRRKPSVRYAHAMNCRYLTNQSQCDCGGIPENRHGSECPSLNCGCDGVLHGIRLKALAVDAALEKPVEPPPWS